ncbi:MAG: zf-HC2 domain-containing protein [Thermoleophilaceae bacterium]|nr:zf-HC2 domain-containing protein [Thermoleophilaceae bacterium]
MDYAPLRPVPLAPAGPVDLDRAVEHVSSRIPGLGEAHAKALALVVIAGSERPAAAAGLGIPEADLGRLLASARTALRRTVRPLEGAGWCLRAESLLSDRLDGALGDSGAGRLGVHLQNCPRCAEHERRLIQAQNSLVAAFGREPSTAVPAELTLVQPEEPASAVELGGIVAVAAGALLLLASLLVIAAIAFALVAVLGV